jgi:ABC-type amino acid transport system permease subunit
MHRGTFVCGLLMMIEHVFFIISTRPLRTISPRFVPAVCVHVPAILMSCFLCTRVNECKRNKRMDGWTYAPGRCMRLLVSLFTRFPFLAKHMSSGSLSIEIHSEREENMEGCVEVVL